MVEGKEKKKNLGKLDDDLPAVHSIDGNVQKDFRAGGQRLRGLRVKG